MTFMTCFFMVLSFGQTVTVNLNAKEQQITMMGTDLERSAGFVQQAADPQKVVDWICKDVPYTACRVSYDKKQEMVEGTKNLSFYDAPIATMKMMRATNPDIKFYATMKSDYNGYGGKNNLPDWICDWVDKKNTYFYVNKYVGFLADYLELMHQNGVTIAYMTVAKEWNAVVTVDRTIAIIEGLLTELPKRGVPVPLFTDPSAWQLSAATNFVNQVVAKGKEDLFHAFSTHHYNGTDGYPAYVEACNKAGKYAWNDEVGYGLGRTGGLETESIDRYIANYTTRAMYYNEGLEGEMLFEITSRGISEETRAIYFTSGTEARRLRTYYIAKLLAENIYLRNYIEPAMSSIGDSVATMAFANDDEVGLWIMNRSTVDYPEVTLNFQNTSVNGDVYHYTHTSETIIQGEASVLEPSASDQYKAHIKAQSINFFKVKLKDKVVQADTLLIDSESVDFGTVASNADPEMFEKNLYVTVENPSTDVQVSITGADANVFSIIENEVITKSPLLWYVPVKVKFTPTRADDFSAQIEVLSGNEKRTIPVTATAFMAETVGLPFLDEFPNQVANSGPLSTSMLNDYTTYQGWTVEGGGVVGGARVQVIASGNPEAHITTPDILFDGPFQLSFYSRMIKSSIGSGDTRTANDAVRNMYAIIGNDTIYDHHKAGKSTLFQNFNKWTCTYAFSDIEKVKFMSKVSSTGVWAGSTDGLSFGPPIKIESTTLPTLNVAYGHRIDLGDVKINSIASYDFNIKGWNLSEGITLVSEDPTKSHVSTSTVDQSGGTIDETVRFSVSAVNAPLGENSTRVVLTGEDSQIRTRHITFVYNVVNSLAVDDVQVNKLKVDVDHNRVTMNSEEALSHYYYNISGHCIASFNKVNYSTITLEPGVYIVKCGNATQKVLVAH